MKKTFLFSQVVFLLSALILFPYIRWYADNPDTFQYIDIARKYMSGDWSHAVNGYWSPLISWLLILPLAVFSDELVAFKILQLCIGIFTLCQWSTLIAKIPLRKSWKNSLVYFVIPFLLNYSLLNCTPDLLFIGVLLMLINIFLNENFAIKAPSFIAAGAAGALLFFSKAFGLPFFLFFSLVLILFNYKSMRTRMGNIIRMYSVFLLICMPWIIIISIQYDHFTISEAAKFNMSREAAPLPGNKGLPVLNVGLNQPPGNAASAWESPGAYTSDDAISPFRNFQEYVSIIKRNFLSIYYYDFRNQAGLAFLLLFLIYALNKGLRNLKHEIRILLFLLVIFAIYVGYGLILVHTRYIWINTLLMVIASAWFIQQIFVTEKLRWLRNGIFVFLLLLAVKRPLKEIFFVVDNIPGQWMFKAAKSPLETLWIIYRPDREMQKTIVDLKSKNALYGNIASLKSYSKERDPYTNALRISRANNCRYFGQLDDKINIENQKQELKKHNINFLVTFQSSWSDEVPVYENVLYGIRIYRIN